MKGDITVSCIQLLFSTHRHTLLRETADWLRHHTPSLTADNGADTGHGVFSPHSAVNTVVKTTCISIIHSAHSQRLYNLLS